MRRNRFAALYLLQPPHGMFTRLMSHDWCHLTGVIRQSIMTAQTGQVTQHKSYSRCCSDHSAGASFSMPDAAVAAGTALVAAPVWQIAVKFDQFESDVMKTAAYVMLMGQKLNL